MSDNPQDPQRTLHAIRGNAPPPAPPPAPTGGRPRTRARKSRYDPNAGYGNAGQVKAFADAIRYEPLEMAPQMPGSFTAQRPRHADPTPPPGFDFQATNREDLPNWDKLSGTERAIYNTLPGLATGLGEAYKKWDADWYGAPSFVLRPIKWAASALGILDVGAEAVERGAGFATQALAAVGTPTDHASWDDFNKDLKAAWYAGGLAADAADVTVEYDPASGSMKVPQVLGGVSQLVRARQRIAELAATGVSYHDALMTAREEYLSSLGALALRSQIQDAFFHVAADPINIILPTLKPVERIQSLRTKITGLQATAEGVAELRSGLRAAEAALEAAQAGGKAEDIAAAESAVERLSNAAERAGQSRLSWGEQKLTQILGLGSEERGAANVVKLTGGAVGEAPGALSKIPILNWFQLTPEARVNEYMTVLLDNLTSHHVAANTLADGTVDVEGLVRSIVRVRDGAFDPQMGNMLMTLEGRSIKAAVAGFGNTAEDMLTAWQQTGKLERPLLDAIAKTLGVSPYAIINRLDKGEAAQIIDLFSKKIAALPEAEQLVAGILARNNIPELTPDVLGRISGVLGDKAFAGYTDQLFVAELTNKLVDHAAQQAIQQFGVKQRGLISNIAETVKAAESLAFLRLNPAYPVRNFINNNVTMIARGAFGTMTEGAIDDFWKRLGFEPARLREGVGLEGKAATDLKIAGQEIHAAQGGLAEANKIVKETTTGSGWTQKLTDAIGRVKPPDVINPAEWAKKVEALASRRAYTAYYIKSFQPFYKAALGKLAETEPALARMLPKSVAGELERAVLAATRDADLSALSASDNLKLNWAEVLHRTESRTGLKLDHVISAEFQTEMEQGLVDAARTGKPEAVREFFQGLETKVQEHLEGAVDESLATLRDEAAAKIKAEGPGAFTHLWGDAMDEWWVGHETHAANIQKGVDLINNGKSQEAHALWQSLTEQEKRFMDRQWNRLEARMQGFAGGAAGAGLNGEAVMGGFRQWRGGWRQFFEKRTRLYDEFFGALREGKQPARAFEDIAAELDTGYAKMAEYESRAQRQIDVGLAGMLPEENRGTFLAWRAKVGQLRQADKEAVMAFRQALPGIPASQRSAEYAALNAKRIRNWRALANEDRAGVAMMSGNQLAFGRYQQAAADLEADITNFTELLSKKASGETLSSGDQGLVDRIANYYATPEEARKLNQLGADKLYDQTNPPVTPTLEGSQALEREASRQALDPATVNIEIPKNYKVTVETGTVEGPKIVYREAHTGGASDWKPYKFLTNAEKADGWRVAPAHEVDLWVEEQSKKLYEGDPNHTWDEIQQAIIDQKRTARRGVGGASAVDNTVADLERQLGQAREEVAKLKGATGVGGKAQALQDAQRRVKALSMQLSASKKAGVAVEVDAAQVAERQATRDAAQSQIEQDIWSRLFDKAKAEAEAKQTASHLPSLEKVVKPELYMGTGIDQLWYTRGQGVLRDLEESTHSLMGEAPLKWGDIPAEAQAGVRSYVERARGAMADARYGAMRMGEYGRDSALLNYSRRFNYNTWLGTIAPYEFWATQSAYKWMLHSIDRPGMLSAYLRLRRFMDTAYRPESGFPERLRGTFRVAIPGLPEWMGKDTFIDPLRLMVPFDGWTDPFEQYGNQQMADIGAAERALEGLRNDGQVTAGDYQDALSTHQGPTWDRAMAAARQDDTEGRMSGMDLATSLLPFHLPLLYGLDAAQGRNPFEENGPILPLTRNIGSVLATLGVDPANGLNPEAAIRKAAGIDPFGKWDTYRAEREVTNMLALGEVSVTDARTAIARHSGSVWQEALQRSYVESAGGNLGTAISGIAGVPLKAYPPGEEYLRSLYDDERAAWTKYDKTGDYGATAGKFYDEHPGFYERLQLRKKPEERLRNFTVDAFWDRWNNLPKLTKDELRDGLGTDFEKFIGDADTPAEIKRANRAGITTEQLAVWLKLMGGDPPGTLSAPGGAGSLPDIQLTDPEAAQRVQVFYDTRQSQFPGWYDAQKAYFDIPEDKRIYTGADPLAAEYLSARDAQFPGITEQLAAYDAFTGPSRERTAFLRANPAVGDYFDWRKQYKAEHPALSHAIGFNDTVKQHSVSARSQYLKGVPVLKAYWQWRDSFLKRNPDLAPHLTDNPEDLPKQPVPMQKVPQFTADEWRTALGFSAYNLLLDYHLGEEPPPGLEDQVHRKAAALGIYGTLEEIAAMVEGAQ